MTRIAISGGMGAGKSTLAALLSQRQQVPVLSFAAGFKSLVEAAGVTKTSDEVLYRKLCQNIGAGMRAYDRDIWVKAFWRRFADTAIASSLIPKSAGCIVDDLRYPNEFESLKAGGFYLVRLEVPADVRATRRTLVEHESETALDGYAQHGQFHHHCYLTGSETPEVIASWILGGYGQWLAAQRKST